MDRRLEFQELLEEILGSRNVYFSPPSGYKMKYPCIVYHFAREDAQHADNRPYIHRQCYEVTSIDRDPCSKTPAKLREIPTAAFNRSFKTDNLSHVAYNIYY